MLSLCLSITKISLGKALRPRREDHATCNYSKYLLKAILCGCGRNTLNARVTARECLVAKKPPLLRQSVNKNLLGLPFHLNCSRPGLSTELSRWLSAFYCGPPQQAARNTEQQMPRKERELTCRSSHSGEISALRYLLDLQTSRHSSVPGMFFPFKVLMALSASSALIETLI